MDRTCPTSFDLMAPRAHTHTAAADCVWLLGAGCGDSPHLTALSTAPLGTKAESGSSWSSTWVSLARTQILHVSRVECLVMLPLVLLLAVCCLGNMSAKSLSSRVNSSISVF